MKNERAWSKSLAVALVGLAVGVGGCQTTDADKAAEGSPRESGETRPASKPAKPANPAPASSGREVLGKPAKTIAPPSAGGGAGGGAGGSAGASAAARTVEEPNAGKWVIVLATVKEGSAEGAAAALDFAKNKVGLSDAYITRRGATTVVAVGAFDDLNDEAALKAMQRVRTAAVDGVQPFVGAFLSPPVLRGTAGSMPDLDLRNAKSTFGEDRAQVTLQVGIYCRMDDRKPTAAELAEFRKAAEAAAIELRRGGELAFYYHGPERSTVTVGLFTQKDLNDGTGGESDELREARQKHPSALVNGMGLRQSEIVPGSKKKGDLQKSFLVTVPKK